MGVTALAYGLPPLAYHLAHLDVLPTAAHRAANVVLLGLGVLAPLALLAGNGGRQG